MKKSVRKNGKVYDYQTIKSPYKQGFYYVEVNNTCLGAVVKTSTSGQVWDAFIPSNEEPEILIEGFISRTRAVECVLKLSGFELV